MDGVPNYSGWKGYRWKHGLYPREDIGHDHCAECGNALAFGPDMCYYFLGDSTKGWRDTDFSKWNPPLVTEEALARFLIEPECLCEKCFHAGAEHWEFTVVGDDEPAPVYPVYV